MNYFTIGNGTNLLVSDRGVDEIIISTKGLKSIEKKDDLIYVDGGISIVKLANFAKKHRLSGFESISGIPGSVGGGIFMNCGSLGGNISDHLEQIDLIDSHGVYKSLKKDEIGFKYRGSGLEGSTIISASFCLKEDSVENITKLMDSKREWRLTHQPLNKPSCGSVFRKCDGISAGQYIDRAGLKGYRKGGAMISDLHANFFLNIDSCSSDDIEYLISLAKEKVFDEFGVELKEEVIRLGR